MARIQELRNAYYDLEIGNADKKEEVWKKKLQHILMTDVHSKPLGCMIADTHIRIGRVHLQSFYEAQILFSHAHWVSRFANWLCTHICESMSSKSRENNELYLIGYETT